MPRNCFVLMPFGEHFDPIFEAAIRPAIREIDLECLRADDVPAAGQALLDKIHRHIREAAIIVADVTGANPNVLYEVGYATALGKNVVLVTRDRPTDVAANLRGLELLTYAPSRAGLHRLKEDLKNSVRSSLQNPVGFLRDMLEPADSGPTYILASPMADPRGRFATRLKARTSGDYLGIVGIIRAFGIIFGERRMPELLDSRIAEAEVVRSNHCYIIGSLKVNRFQREYLDAVQKGQSENWRFVRRPGDRRRDYEVILTGRLDCQKWIWRKPEDPPYNDNPTDYGLLVRGPHPYMDGKTIMILAGAHSIGTGAACLAATESTLVSQIADKLSELAPAYSLADKSCAFWVLVKGEGSEDRHLSADRVTIERVGLYS